MYKQWISPNHFLDEIDAMMIDKLTFLDSYY